MNTPWHRRAVVYRCFDRNGVLLYVGSSVNVDGRIETHYRSSFWAGRIARVRLVLATDELDARRREAEIIRAENPRYNLHHRRPRPQWTEQDYLDVIDAIRSGPASYTAYNTQRLIVLQRQLEAFRAGAVS